MHQILSSMNSTVDRGMALEARIERDYGPPARRSRNRTLRNCPFHPDRTPSFVVFLDTGQYHCFGCGAHGDEITWMIQFHGLAFQEARDKVSSIVPTNNLSGIVNMTSLRTERPKPDNLQGAWKALIGECARQLWSDAGKKARQYLHHRGLKDDVLQSPFFRVGYSPGFKTAGVWVDRGIVLPCFSTNGELEIEYVDYIKIRRPAGRPKYKKLTGYGATTSGLFGASSFRGADVIFITEGEIDALLLYQEANDLVDVGTLGGATEPINLGHIGPYLIRAHRIFVVYDNDPAGQLGADQWTKLTQRARSVKVPLGKDINDLFLAQRDLRSWVLQHLKESPPGT